MWGGYNRSSFARLATQLSPWSCHQKGFARSKHTHKRDSTEKVHIENLSPPVDGAILNLINLTHGSVINDEAIQLSELVEGKVYGHLSERKIAHISRKNSDLPWAFIFEFHQSFHRTCQYYCIVSLLDDLLRYCKANA